MQKVSFRLFLRLFLVRIQLDAEHGLFQLAAALRLQTGFIGLSGQIQGEPPLAQHSGNAGAGSAHGGVGGFIGGFGGGQLCKAHLKQLAAVQIGLQRDVVVVALEQSLVGGLGRDGAHGDHDLVAVNAGAPGGQGGDIPGHDVLNDGVQIVAYTQIVGQVVQGIVDHSGAPPQAASPSPSRSVTPLPKGEALAKPETLSFCQGLPLWGSCRTK